VLDYDYKTSKYYDLTISHRADTWQIELSLRALPEPVEKSFKERLFSDHVEEPRLFVARMGGEEVGWIELGYHGWNNRMRVWNMLVKEPHRRTGIGTLLMRRAEQASRERGARMLVLETQSCNVPAIGFYLKHGFSLIGFDSAAYTNEDADRREVRLEFGLPIAA
jgi:ribosomal protein S18 acetylase RimI-like enzyme